MTHEPTPRTDRAKMVAYQIIQEHGFSGAKDQIAKWEDEWIIDMEFGDMIREEIDNRWIAKKKQYCKYPSFHSYQTFFKDLIE